MKNRLSLITAAILLAGAQAAQAAQADDISIAWQGNAALAGVQLKAYDHTLSSTEPVFDDYALQLNYTNLGTGASFAAFCIEPLANNSTLAATYSMSAFTGSQGTHLAALYQTAFSNTMSATQQAAFQLAVWEFTQETANAQGVSSFGTQTGTFRITGPAEVTSLADAYVAGALSFTGTSSYQVVRLSSADYQDLVMANAVPEPQTYLMLLGGLGLLGFVARRRLPR